MIMKALVIESPHSGCKIDIIPIPQPSENQIQIKVSCCGICRTDVHLLDDELPNISYPIVPGHQVVGRVSKVGANVKDLKVGQRVGVSWLANTCGSCEYCQAQQENLCRSAELMGYTSNGGLAEYCVVDSHFCYQIPSPYTDEQMAPLLCGGFIGYRAYRMINSSAKRIGFYGFGSAAQIMHQIASKAGKKIYAFTSLNDMHAKEFAKELGAEWVGDSNHSPPDKLDAAIIFAPVGHLVPRALAALKKGGEVICACIHMSDIPSFQYRLLWGERSIKTVANLTRGDAKNFFNAISKINIESKLRLYAFQNAVTAIKDLKQGYFTGSAVVVL